MDYVSIDNILCRNGTSLTSVVARARLPSKMNDGDWLCVLEIRGIEGEGKFRAFGVDSFQAMQLGMRTLLDILKNSSEQKRGDLLVVWETGESEPLDIDTLFGGQGINV